METLRFARFAAVPGLVAEVVLRTGGVSPPPWGSLNLGGGTGDEPERVAENRRRVVEALGFAGLVTARQVHGTRVAGVGSPADDPGEADALETDVPGVLLGALGADCPGVVLADPVRRVVAVLHAGWRGTVAGVVGEAVRALAERHASRPADLLAGIGPGISGARYEVGPEVAAGIRRAGLDLEGVLRAGTGDRWHLSLADALAHACVRAGIPRGSVETLPGCTYDDAARLFSHRRDGARTGRHALVAGWTR